MLIPPKLADRVKTPKHNPDTLKEFGQLEDKKYIVALDLELTCWEAEEIKTHLFPQSQEIIEIGCVVINARTLEILRKFYVVVKPWSHPILSKYCIELTGITQIEVNTSSNLIRTIKGLVSTGMLPDPREFVFCTWGNDAQWLHKEVQSKYSGYESPRFPSLPNFDPRVLNLAQFCKALSLPGGLRVTIDKLGLEMVCPQHRALNDALSTYNLLKHFKLGPEDCYISNEKTYKDWAYSVMNKTIKEVSRELNLEEDKVKELLKALAWDKYKVKKIVSILK